jgi:hypothetical protein
MTGFGRRLHHAATSLLTKIGLDVIKEVWPRR